MRHKICLWDQGKGSQIVETILKYSETCID